MSTLKITNIQHASAASAAITLASDGSAAATLSSLNGGPLSGARNRILNGDMRLDQRNAGASVSLPVGNTYVVDRWFVGVSGAAVTGQRVAGTGSFKNAFRITGGVSNAGVFLTQRIEAQNIYDLASSNVVVRCRLAASAITSVTWTAYYANSEDNFSGVTQIATGTITGISSTAADYTFTFNAGANVGNGLQLTFTLGTMTSGTFDITGVQLEAGTVATPFERRSYGQELALCQRYYQKTYESGTVPGTNITSTYLGAVTGSSNSNGASNGFTAGFYSYKVSMRAVPTVSYWDMAGNASRFSTFTFGGQALSNNVNAFQSTYIGSEVFQFNTNTPAATTPLVALAFSSEL